MPGNSGGVDGRLALANDERRSFLLCTCFLASARLEVGVLVFLFLPHSWLGVGGGGVSVRILVRNGVLTPLHDVKEVAF
uniref:Secreted protein n=1 Tax=Panagrellus redivivus TaxID=6233 RepID=A0A7E4VY03_PANRE